jgi:hypothetical protein
VRLSSILVALALAGCSQSYSGPAPNPCGAGVAVSNGSGWTCTSPAQLAVGSAAIAVSATNATQVTSAVAAINAADAGTALAFASDARVWLGGPATDPTAKIALAKRTLEIGGYSVPAYWQTLPVSDLLAGSGSPTTYTQPIGAPVGPQPVRLRMRAWGTLYASTGTANCELELTVDGTPVTSVVITSSGEPHTWVLEGETDLPGSGTTRDVGLRLSNLSGAGACHEDSTAPAQPAQLTLEAFNHGD